MTPQRPMLGPALDALTNERDHRHYDASPSVLLRTGATRVTTSATGVDLWVRDEYGWGFRWRTTDPAEAWELLQARDLVPLDCRSRFVCEDCGGTGGPYVGGCLDCNAIGHRPHPSTVAALASWASLGWAPADDGHPGIAGAEELAREIAPGFDAWWRVRELQHVMDTPTGADPADRLRVAGIVPVDPGLTRRVVLLYVPPLGSAR